MLTIAYILKMYPRFSETFIVNEILELERRGINVRIYSLHKPDDGRFHASLSRVKAPVIYVPQYPEMEPDRIQNAHRTLRQAHPEAYFRVYTQTQAKADPYAIKRFLQAGFIAEHMLHNPVDAMHAHFASSATRVANLIYHLIGVPYSLTAHAKDIFHDSVQPASLRGKIRDARFVVTVSDFNRSYLEEMMDEETADIRRLYNGIDLQRFRPSRTPRGGNLILSVGRLVEKKGFDVLIRACSLLAEWGLEFECEIIGKGDHQSKLQKLIDTYGLQTRVRLVGPKPQEEVRKAYQHAAIFALPCIIGQDGNRDGLPTVLLEAMATGLPVVSTALTGIPEIIDDDENGLVVPPGDAEALAKALASLLENPTLRERMGMAGRRKVEQCFDVRKSVSTLRRWLMEPIVPNGATHTELPSPDLPEELVFSAPLSIQQVFAII